MGSTFERGKHAYNLIYFDRKFDHPHINVINQSINLFATKLKIKLQKREINTKLHDIH